MGCIGYSGIMILQDLVNNDSKSCSIVMIRSNNDSALVHICVARYPLQVRHKPVAQSLHRAFRFYRG